MSSHNTAETVLSKLQSLRLMVKGGQISPHKLIFILTLARLFEDEPTRKNRFPLEENLQNKFSEIWLEFFPETQLKTILIELPFYHLKNDQIWQFEYKQGKESVFQRYENTPHMRLTRSRLVETVEFGSLTSDVEACFRDDISRRKIISYLNQRIAEISFPGEKEKEGGKESISLFVHEEASIKLIKERIKSQRLGIVLQNLELHDPQSNRYFEIDLIVISSFGIFIVELKHWSGRIEIRPYSWIQNNSFFHRDPHKANNHKAKLLRGLYERRFPHYPNIYFESVVVLTNPEATVDGASVPKTTENNPSFDSIERFIKYLKLQQERDKKALNDSQCGAFAEYLSKLHKTDVPRDFLFPGYEIVERLYHRTDRAEVVARRTDDRHRRLSRLRVFFPPTSSNKKERRVFHERATATLNAVAKVGDHPNILKVWAVPNENNFIVEGSDWSETGTLQDVLGHEGKFSSERATKIIIGILHGLNAIHEECVIHRALSPTNILMVGDTPKLMNFDLSFQLEENRITVIPDVSKLKRNPYTAPEVYKGDVIPEASADLFSTGVIFYEMLTGELPFACSTDLEHSGGELSKDKHQILKENNVPNAIHTLISNLIRIDPQERTGNLNEILNSIEPKSEMVSQEPNMLLKPGAQSGFYEIESFLKHGVQSQIYLARGARSRKVIIKLFDSDVLLQRVLQEQEFAGAIHHTSIIRVENYSRWNEERFYISFDWISGESLRDVISKGEPAIDKFIRVASQLLEAIVALHTYEEEGEKCPILHNDIKPENIIITSEDRPVIIDFGTASHPCVGLYEGTEGYVAPDLRLGQDRKYSEDGDLYSLGITMFEWFFGHRPYDLVSDGKTALELSKSRTNISRTLFEWFEKAVDNESKNRFHSAEQMLESLTQIDEPVTISQVEEIQPVEIEDLHPIPSLKLDRIKIEIEDDKITNPFVAYLNSLHSRDAGSENALAESQARNKYFGFIHVRHPIAEMVQKILLGNDRRHAILTGHAGDGKSTIGIELYKQLNGIPLENPLDQDLSRREEVKLKEKPVIVLIKDFSEWSFSERKQLLEEILDNNDQRFLLISNTGTLLDTFKDYERDSGRNWVKTESDILDTIAAEGVQDLPFHDEAFSVINLSMLDNLKIANQILSRMIAEERWTECKTRECHDRCPIFRNVEMIRNNQKVVFERIFLIYSRMYEYGVRLTLRQITAHLAYLITSGLSYQDIKIMLQKAKPPMMSEFMFFNRFFGDNGRQVDKPALQLNAVREIRKQSFGNRTCPSWERKLWIQKKDKKVILIDEGFNEEFEFLRRLGARLTFDDAINDAHARQQVRRMLYFLHSFEKSEGDSFLKAFLNSLMILDFNRWQNQKDNSLTLKDSTTLFREIVHVLQEHFTGIRIPEGTSTDGNLYITLSRHSHQVRQSAQVVLARFPEDDFVLSLVRKNESLGAAKRELVLDTRSSRIESKLPLDLPFLDYVMMRKRGEVGQDLNASYSDRLEKFKGYLLRQEKDIKTEDLMLVRLRTNHTFRRQIYAIRQDRMEVTDG